jgi:hypothetical protein
MDEQGTAATKELARLIVAACAPLDLGTFDETVDELLDTLEDGGYGRDKPTEFGGAVLFPLAHLALLLARHLQDVLPSAVLEVILGKSLEKAIERRHDRSAKRRGKGRKGVTSAPAAEELLSVQVTQTQGEHASTVVRVAIGEKFYPAAAQTAVALLGYVAQLGEGGFGAGAGTAADESAGLEADSAGEAESADETAGEPDSEATKAS